MPSSALRSQIDVSKSQIKLAVSLVRRQSFDLSTPEGRSLERYRRLLFTVFASVLARAIGVAATLISVPLTLNYLGAERYGLWNTISSFVAILAFADFGIGNGLLSALATVHGTEDRAAAKVHVSSTFFILSAIALAIGSTFFLAYSHIPWEKLLNIQSPETVAEAGPTFAVFVACFLINLPLGVVQRIQLGYQEGFISNLWQALGSLMSLIGLCIAVYFEAGLPWLVLAAVGSPLLATGLNAAQVFLGRYSWLRPSWSQVSWASGRMIANVGWLYFVLQLAGAVAFLSDNIVVTQLLGPEMVPQFSVPAKLFAFAPMILGMVLTPLWPAYGEALARGDIEWVRQTLKRSLKLGFAVNVPIAIVLTTFGGPIIHAWIGPTIDPSPVLLAGLGAWLICNAMTGPFAMFLNGVGVVRFQVVSAVIMATVNLLLSITLTNLIGVSGVVWGSVLSLSTCTLLPIIIYLPKIFAVLESRNR